MQQIKLLIHIILCGMCEFLSNNKLIIYIKSKSYLLPFLFIFIFEIIFYNKMPQKAKYFQYLLYTLSKKSEKVCIYERDQ